MLNFNLNALSLSLVFPTVIFVVCYLGLEILSDGLCFLPKFAGLRYDNNTNCRFYAALSEYCVAYVK